MRIKPRSELDKIRRVATQVRKALDAIDMKATRSSILRDRDCGHTALLLAMYLEEKGCGVFDYVNRGRLDRDGYHSWLQQGDLVVDISGKEFSDCPDSIVVARGSDWHSRFPK